MASFQEGLQCNHLGYHCSSTWKAIQNNCRWNWQGICWFIVHWCQRIILHRNEIVGVEVAMQIDIWWNEDIHLLEYVGTTTYCGMLRIACLDLVLWLQYFCFWGGQIHLLRGSEALMRWFGRCRSVQIKRLHSYVIGEETCKWQCVYCIVIYWEWG